MKLRPKGLRGIRPSVGGGDVSFRRRLVPGRAHG